MTWNKSWVIGVGLVVLITLLVLWGRPMKEGEHSGSTPFVSPSSEYVLVNHGVAKTNAEEWILQRFNDKGHWKLSGPSDFVTGAVDAVKGHVELSRIYEELKKVDDTRRLETFRTAFRYYLPVERPKAWNEAPEMVYWLAYYKHWEEKVGKLNYAFKTAPAWQPSKPILVLRRLMKEVADTMPDPDQKGNHTEK